MKLFSSIAASIAASFITANPAEAFWGNKNQSKLVGRWECVATSPGRVGSKGTYSFDSGMNVQMTITNETTYPTMVFKARSRSSGKYSLNGNIIKVYNLYMEVENLSYKMGNSAAENRRFRESVGQDLPSYRSMEARKSSDVYLEISAISGSHLILQPEGGGSAEIICKK